MQINASSAGSPAPEPTTTPPTPESNVVWVETVAGEELESGQTQDSVKVRFLILLLLYRPQGTAHVCGFASESRRHRYTGDKVDLVGTPTQVRAASRVFVLDYSRQLNQATPTSRNNVSLELGCALTKRSCSCLVASNNGGIVFSLEFDVGSRWVTPYTTRIAKPSTTRAQLLQRKHAGPEPQSSLKFRFDLTSPQNNEGSSNTADYMRIQTIAGVAEVRFQQRTSTLVKI